MVDNKFDLNLLRLFVTIVEAPNLSVAAERSHTTRSNISHRLKALETTMKAQLVRRTTRRMELTEAGRTLYQHCIRMLEELDSARASIDNLGNTIAGDVRIRLPTGLGHIYLTPVLLDFARAHPQVSLRVMLTDHISDLISAEVDVALKITSTPPDDYVARKLCDIQWCICAAPSYLEDRPIANWKDLQSSALITPAALGRSFDLKLGRDKVVTAVRVTPRIQSGDFPFLISAVAEGLGIALLPRYAVWQSLREGCLTEVLTEYEPQGVGNAAYLLTAPNRFPTLATRAVMQFIVQHVKANQSNWSR
ncbi:LysR family transcriptional regulator [Paraburkholderia sp. GAS32]|uniref:LysR family transcriptional regulator n=1 Tax=Paraburkholderia sp. GAS32 TaxID=3035129 RepID=UPI003D1A0CE9